MFHVKAICEQRHYFVNRFLVSIWTSQLCYGQPQRGSMGECFPPSDGCFEILEDLPPPESPDGVRILSSLPCRVGVVDKGERLQLGVDILNFADDGLDFVQSVEVEVAGREWRKHDLRNRETGSLAGCVPTPSVYNDVVVGVLEFKGLRSDGFIPKLDACVLWGIWLVFGADPCELRCSLLIISINEKYLFPLPRQDAGKLRGDSAFSCPTFFSATNDDFCRLRHNGTDFSSFQSIPI